MKTCIRNIDSEYSEVRIIPKAHTECVQRPTDDHVLSDTWQNDPMDVDVCWRVKNTGELDTELDEKVNFANVDPFLKAYVLAVNDGSIAQGSNMTPAALKSAIKAKL
ncbi:MAG: hypothetical protein KAT69_07925 [Candidatus Aminicenantes bacterium]|nr:hypothetical protein [Candidatus Aminicenantes bacterium]